LNLLHVIIVNRKRLCGFYAKTGKTVFNWLFNVTSLNMIFF
jgi:hypothetical protein